MRDDEGSHRSSTTVLPAELASASAGDSKGQPSSRAFQTGVAPSIALRKREAVYKGEGNANVVVALPQEQTVIRFRKSLPDEVSPDGGEARVLREVGFARDVVSCCFGSYVHIPEIVRYDAIDIAELSDAIRPLRPEKRRHKEIADTCAMKYPDYTLLDSRLSADETVFRSRATFCVEIKPKQGYLPTSERKFPACPFCLTQYAKLRRRSIPARSNYCPFDLFSGVEARMKAAVAELLKSPQNNLKIFRDGLVVHDQKSSPGDLENTLAEWFRNATCRDDGKRILVDEFCNLVCAALTRPFAQEQLEPSDFSRLPVRNSLASANQRVPVFCADEPNVVIARAERCLRLAGKICNFDGDELPRGSVLERIRDAQQWSCVSPDYIYGLYSEFASLLNDDMIYPATTNVESGRVAGFTETDCCTSLEKRANAVGRKVQTIEKTYFQALFENAASRKYNHDDDGLNGNRDTDTDCIVSADIDHPLVSTGFISQAEISSNLDSRRSSCGTESPHHRTADCEDDERKTTKASIITAEHLSALRNYLLFTMAKDCSILMTFRELHPKYAPGAPVGNTIKLSEELCFLCSVRISDLDPKSVHCIAKHRQRDADVLDSVIATLEQPDGPRQNV